MDISAIGNQSISQSATAATGLAENFDTFLTLLTEQLQNQDPLDPMDTNEFTSQLVQYTSVEQAIATNDNLEQLIALQSGNGFSMALDYLGTQVEAAGDTSILSEGSAKWQYTLTGSAEQTALTVLNEAGQIVFVDEGQTATGAHDFIWDGRDNAGNLLPDGAYTLNIAAQDGNGATIGARTAVNGVVETVSMEGGEPILYVNGMKLQLSDIFKVSQLPAES
ncbi:MAG: flagellar hook assembly protein FlgD [Pseudomonadota bacterium]